MLQNNYSSEVRIQAMKIVCFLTFLIWYSVTMQALTAVFSVILDTSYDTASSLRPRAMLLQLHDKVFVWQRHK